MSSSPWAAATLPIFPGKRYEDRKLDDRPAGDRQCPTIRDDIRTRVLALIDELLPAQ